VQKNVIFFCEKCLTVWVGAWYNRATPPGGEGGRESSTYCANLSKIAAWVVVSVVGVDVAVVLRPIVDRLCDIVAGGTVIVVAVVRTVELLWRDGGEAGDFVLRINHRIHAYRVEGKQCGRKKKKQKKEKKLCKKALTTCGAHGIIGLPPPRGGGG